MRLSSCTTDDPDFRGAKFALARAAAAARELGRRTGTPVYVLRDGKIIDLTTEDAANSAGRSDRKK